MKDIQHKNIKHETFKIETIEDCLSNWRLLTADYNGS